MANITLYTETDYQGESLTVPLHTFIEVYVDSVWLFSSAKLNGNKLRVGANFSEFKPIAKEETYVSEDVPNLAELVHLRDDLHRVLIHPISKEDIIVSMDVHNYMRGLMTLATSAVTEKDIYVYGESYENYTLDSIRATLAIIDPAYPDVEVPLIVESTALLFVDKTTIEYINNAQVALSYSSENSTLDVTVTSNPLLNPVTYTVEKIDKQHFLIHFTLVTENYAHVFLHTKEDYGDLNIMLANGISISPRDAEGNWQYTSLEIISNYHYNLAMLWTEYPEEGIGYDFNQYRSHVSTTSLPVLPAIFDGDSSPQVTCAFNTDILPIFLRPINAESADDWKSFVIESSYSSHLLIHMHTPTTYNLFCSNNPDALQESVMCIISQNNLYTDFDSCTLRYGTLSADGATVTWSGETAMNIEYGAADNLIVSLAEDAPAGWEITSVTRGEDGWYVDITGTAS